MKQWIDQTQELLDFVTEAEGALHSITTLIKEAKSPVTGLWRIAISESMPKGLTLERIREAITSLRDELAPLVRTMKEQK